MDQRRVELLEKYIIEEPDSPFNVYALAMEYFEDNSKKASELLNSILIRWPEYLPTYYKLAHLYWESSNWDKADVVFKRGIQLAMEQNDQKALSELKSAYQNFEFDRD